MIRKKSDYFIILNNLRLHLADENNVIARELYSELLSLYNKSDITQREIFDIVMSPMSLTIFDYKMSIADIIMSNDDKLFSDLERYMYFMQDPSYQ